MKFFLRSAWIPILIGSMACNYGKGGSSTGPSPIPSGPPATVIVTVMANRLPLSGASVNLSGFTVTMSAVTGPDGRATISNVPQGSYRLFASAYGFSNLEQPAEVQDVSVSLIALMVPMVGDDVVFDEIVDDAQGVLSSGATLLGYPATLRIRGRAKIVSPLPANGFVSIGVTFQSGSFPLSIGNQVGGNAVQLLSSGSWEKVFVITGRPFSTNIGVTPPQMTYYNQTDTIGINMQNGPRKLVPLILNFP